MKTIKKDEMVLNLDGKPIKLEGHELAFGRAYALAVVSGSKSANPLKAYQLARKIEDAKGEVELTDEEVDFIKEALAGFQGFTTLVIGQLLEKLQ